MACGDGPWITALVAGELVDNPVDRVARRAVALLSARRGRAQANGSDRINAHAAGRFLRASSDARLARRRGPIGRSQSAPCERCGPARASRLPDRGRASTVRLPFGGSSVAAGDAWRDAFLGMIARWVPSPRAAGVVALIAAFVTLRSFGPRYRVGRLLAATPAVTVAQARQLAEAAWPTTSGSAAGSTPRTRSRTPTTGRSCSAGPASSPGPAAAGRRSRTRARPSRSRSTRASTRSASTARRSDDGLVVVPRESEGLAGDIGDRAPADLDPATPVRASSSRSRRSSTRSSSACRRRAARAARSR